MKKIVRHNNIPKAGLYTAVFFLLLFAFFGLRYMAEKKYQPDLLVKNTRNTIYKLGIQCVESSDQVYNYLLQKKKIRWEGIDAYLADFHANIVIYKKDSAIYWNTNQIPLDQLPYMTLGKQEILFSGNKIYVGLKSLKQDYTVAIFYPITKKILPFGVEIDKHRTPGKNEYALEEFNVIVKIKPHALPPFVLTILFLLYATIILYLAILLFLLYQKLENRFPNRRSNLFFFSYLIDLIILRVVQYYLGFPEIFKTSFWNSAKISSLPGFTTPGDLMLNFLLFCVALYLLLAYLSKQQKPWKKNAFVRLLVIQFFVFTLPVVLYFLAESILQNGGLMLLPENVYFKTTGIIRLFLLLLVNLLLYLWTGSFLNFYKQKGLSFWSVIITLTVVTLLFVWLIQIENTIIFLSYALTVLLTTIFWFIQRDKKPYFHSILTILLLSLSAAYLLNVNEQESRDAQQQFTANMLTQKQDPYLQYLLKTQAKEILNDTTITQTIRSDQEEKEQQIATYLNKKYFHGLLSSYSRQVTLCEPGQQLVIQPDNKVVGCNDFFKQLQGKVVTNEPNFKLSLVNSTSESIYYLARFHYPNLLNDNKGVNLYVEFYTNIIPKGLGYPELLQDAGTGELHLSGYSFAFYGQGKLEYKFGDYLFPIDLANFKEAPVRKFFNKDGYTHYMLPVNNKEILLVSRPAQNLSGWLLPFSLLFILSGVFLLVYVSLKFGRHILETFSNSFSTRLQLTIFSAMMFVFLVFTAIILYYFNVNNKKTISNNLKEKTHSVMIELQHKLSPNGTEALQNRQEIQSYLQKFSRVFFSDINLYDNSGWLIVSSRPEIFSQGLQSKLINPKAFVEIEKNHKLFFLGKEKIQNVAFYSSYAPFILNNGEEAGILNLPFFARQSELQHTYYQMLANLINLFVITGMLGMLLMVYLSRLLTRPLNILQHKIGSVSIDKQNEKIEWNRNDEIGKLIEAYNQMVEKLEESARLLKYSAREKAWREMARQIAHEIRNPLTPMKLNVQYLQKVYTAKDPAFDEKFKSVSRSLINQIDTMDEVAGMFADFSKIKNPLDEKADLMEAITSTATLFKKSYQIKITIESEHDNIEVKTSMQDLLRIFNNLMKNAVQSMETMADKNIQILVLKRKKFVEVRMTDNGKGINEEDKEHIFQPYFTTKSKGTGLGLAIVKNLMTETGGEISFVSEAGTGTTFLLKFPLAES